mmetsp:Transcript_110974/g.192146  ORF Transcript_110974/g.192146 Transcript_110974/m.192146 type:complete len:365 (+) Transcript_110974:1650-2744(+)
MASMVFIALAVNSWRLDVKEFSSTPATGFVDNFYALMVIWVTSPNYKAAVALWSLLQNANPAILFGIEPNYTSIPLTQVPLIPCGPSWMPSLQWIYAILLLPYNAPNAIVMYILGCLLCFCKCCVVFGITKVTCCCNLYVLLVILTLGLWGGAKDALAGYWDEIWPFYYISFLQLYAYFIAVLFVLMYALYLEIKEGIDKDKFMEQLQKQLQLVKAEAPATQGEKVQNVVPGRLLQFQDQSLKDAFQDYQKAETEEENADEGDITAATQVIRLKIVLQAVSSQALIMLIQLIVIYTCRILVSEGTAGYFQAAATTVTERKIGVYFQYLKSSARTASEEGMKTMRSHNFNVDFLEERLQVLWNLL